MSVTNFRRASLKNGFPKSSDFADIPGVSVVIPPIVTTGLLAHYDTTNTASYPTSGSTWFDISGNSLDLTLNNTPAYNSGFGGYLNFDGTNENAIRTSVSALYSRTVWSIQGWWRSTATDASANIFFSIGKDGGAGSVPLILTGTSGVNSGNPYAEGGSGAYSINSSTSSLNIWTNFALTSDGTTVTFYQQGASVGTNTRTGTTSGGSGIAVGCFVGGAGAGDNFAPGDASVYLVYTSSLSAADVLQNYDNKKTIYGY